MAEEDAVAEPPSGREDGGTAGSGRSEEPNGAPDESAHDVDSKPPRPDEDNDQEAGGTSTDGPKPGSTGAYRAPGSSASTRKRDKKKKCRGGGLDGEPAMSVEDLFVTISTVQVCTLYFQMYSELCIIATACSSTCIYTVMLPAACKDQDCSVQRQHASCV